MDQNLLYRHLNLLIFMMLICFYSGLAQKGLVYRPIEISS